MNIGKLRHDVDVASEYLRLAEEDEQVGLVLKQQRKYRHACYFIIQAMEKYIRAKVFTIVNPKLEYFRERHRSHSVEDAAAFLIEVYSIKPDVERQVREQLEKYVIGGVRFNLLHNNLRYPLYSNRHKAFSSLDISEADVNLLVQRLGFLKALLKDIDRLS